MKGCIRPMEHVYDWKDFRQPESNLRPLGAELVLNLLSYILYTGSKCRSKLQRFMVLL